MQPFIYNKLFEVNKGLHGEVIFFENKKVLFVDNFFKNFADIQNTIAQFPPGDWKYAEPTKNYVDYFDCKIMLVPPENTNFLHIAKDMIKQQYEADTEVKGHVHVNWFKQIKEKQNNYAWPHDDEYIPDVKLYTCLVYLNSKETSSGGTVFFNNVTPNTNNECIDYWGADPKCWQEIGHINMVPNRIVVFPSEYWHAAYHPDNAFYNDPRVTFVFQLGTI
jgi:hypothetical protein